MTNNCSVNMSKDDVFTRLINVNRSSLGVTFGGDPIVSLFGLITQEVGVSVAAIEIDGEYFIVTTKSDADATAISLWL